jgi:hypothetical protein
MKNRGIYRTVLLMKLTFAMILPGSLQLSARTLLPGYQCIRRVTSASGEAIPALP